MPASTSVSAVRSRVPPAEPIASASPSASKASVGAIIELIRSPGTSSPTIRSTSPSMLFRCMSRPGSKSPEPRPRLVVKTHAFPSESTTDTLVVCVSGPLVSSTGSSARTRSVSLKPRSGGRRGSSCGQAGEAAAREHARARVVDLERIAPARLVRREVVRGHDAAPMPHEREHGLGERAGVDATPRPRRRAARAPSRGRAAAAGRRAATACRPARRCARPRPSSSPARASRGRMLAPESSRRRRARAAAPARTGRARADVRSASAARRARPARRERRTTQGRSRSGRAPRRTAPAASTSSPPLARRDAAEAVEVRRGCRMPRPSRSRSPPPSRPVITVSATHDASDAATAASAALPPAARISAPAAAVAGLPGRNPRFHADWLPY